jgi:hypothetical protein
MPERGLSDFCFKVGPENIEVQHGAGIQARRNRAAVGRLHDHARPRARRHAHEVATIKGRRFPTCGHCKGHTFQLTQCREAWYRRSIIYKRNTPKAPRRSNLVSIVPVWQELRLLQNSSDQIHRNGFGGSGLSVCKKYVRCGSRINGVRSSTRSPSGLSEVDLCLPIGRMRSEALRCVG